MVNSWTPQLTLADEAPANALLSARLSGDGAESFKLGNLVTDSSTGVSSVSVLTKVSLSYERGSSYSLQVTVSDTGMPPLSTEFSVTVTVADIAEDPAVGWSAGTVLLVAESAGAGAVVGAPLTATDEDEGQEATLSFEVRTLLFRLITLLICAAHLPLFLCLQIAHSNPPASLPRCAGS